MLMSTAVIFAMTFQATFLPVYLDELRYSATAIGILFSLRAAASMIVRPFMSRITDAHGNRSRTMVSMTILLAASMGFIGLLDGYGPLAVAVALTGMGSGVSQPLSLVAVADHTAAARRGFAIGLRLTGNRLAQVASPILLGILVEIAGFGIAFGVAGVLLLATALAILGRAQAFERAERRLARPTTPRPG
jgi:MFS family permease